MVFPLYSIRDSLVGYGVPFCADNDAVAMRYFNQAISQPNSIYQMNKNQFDLYCVGEYDNQSGEIDSKAPRFICSATDFGNDKE